MFFIRYLGIAVRAHVLPIVSKPAIKCPSSKVSICTILADSCRNITFFKLVMTDRIDWFIGWQFDEVRLDKETVKSGSVVCPLRTHTGWDVWWVDAATTPVRIIHSALCIRVVGVVVLVRRVVV
jgi:hypothetical protein